MPDEDWSLFGEEHEREEGGMFGRQHELDDPLRTTHYWPYMDQPGMLTTYRHLARPRSGTACESVGPTDGD